MLSAIVLSILVIIAAVISEIFSRDEILPSEISRKIFHIIAGISAAVSVKIIDDKTILIIFGIAAILITYFLLRFNVFYSIRQSRQQSWGIFHFPVSYTILIVLLFPTYNDIIFVSMLIFGISDSLAAIIGSIFAKTYYKLTSDEKSVLGSVIFFITSTAIIFSYPIYFIEESSLPTLFNSILDAFLLAFSVSLILTVTEAISSRGSDNLIVPIFSAALLYIFWNTSQLNLTEQFTLGVVLSAVIALISIGFKFLTNNGSAATFILAAFILGLGGWKWAVPIMTFFILSSVLSKIRKRSNESIETFFEKSGTRDYLQVLANGGIGGVLVIYNQIFPSEVNYYIYLASLSAVCADTWATEIGTMQKRVTYNILNFRKIEQGTSGGISIVGTMGAILGSLVIAFSGLLWVDFQIATYFLVIITAGLLGSFFDSFLGATIQAQGKCNICEKVTEKNIHCGANTSHYRGYKWLNNDGVNFLSAVFSSVFILLINYFN